MPNVQLAAWAFGMWEIIREKQMPEYSFVKNGIAAPKYKFNFCVNYGGL